MKPALRLVATEPALPRDVLELAAREQEVATIVYRCGTATAKDVEALLAKEVSNAAIRSMLTRLCDKKILKRRKRVLNTPRSGRRVAFVYLPAITDAHVQETAIRRLAEDFFGGSVRSLIRAADQLAKSS